MPNMSLEKIAMPVQDGIARSKNFDEVALGYTEAMAKEEAARCLHCINKPCVAGCPVGIEIPTFIEQINKDDFEGGVKNRWLLTN